MIASVDVFWVVVAVVLALVGLVLFLSTRRRW